MANKTKATPQKDEAHEKHPETSDARQPLLDVIETEEAEADDEGAREETDSEETESGDLVEVTPKRPAKSEAKQPIEHSDDPVRVYLREIGSIELLSRQGEVAIETGAERRRGPRVRL